MVRKEFRIRSSSSYWKYLTPLLGIPVFIYRAEIEDKIDRSFHEEEVELVQEYTLQSKKYAPEEFYIKLYQSDDFLPAGFSLNCNPSSDNCKAEDAFLSLDGRYHVADMYSFAIQGVKSGHRPHNRISKVSVANDQTVTWLDAVRTLTKLKPENRDDQELIRSWIAANYTHFTTLEDVLDKNALQFISDANGEVKDIVYTGKNKDRNYSLNVYTKGSYRTKVDNSWEPTNEIKEKFVISGSNGHLILPVTNNVNNMLIVPDYLMKEIDIVSAAVYTGRGRHSKYIIRLEEINAELKQLKRNKYLRIDDGDAQTILTPTLELVVQDICRNKNGREAKLEALLETLQKEPYSDSKFNSPPLVTLVAGGQCGATSGQFAAMLQLCGFEDYQFVHFPKANHIGVYIPKEEHTSMDLSGNGADKYWYVETTNAKKSDFASILITYFEGKINVTDPQVFDLRTQLQYLPSAQMVKMKGYHNK